MPIVRFNRHRGLVHWDTMGYEALLRGPDHGRLRRPDTLFALARVLGITRELDLWCVDRSLELQLELPRTANLFINVGIETLLSSEFQSILERHAQRLETSRVVFEILEGHIPSIVVLRELIARFSAMGYRFAIDDIGGKGSGLGRMVQIGPVQYLKIDRHFLQQVWAKDPERARGWLQGIRETARVTGAQIILEGIEASALGLLPEMHRMGITLGQGYLFGAAAPLPARLVVSPRRTLRTPVREGKLATIQTEASSRTLGPGRRANA